MEGTDDGAARQRESEALVEERRDLAERDPELFVERHGKRERLRPELDRRGAERVGGLPGMTALHPTVALGAAADVHPEAAHDGTDDREILLVLIGDALGLDPAPTRRTARRERRLVGLVDHRRHGALAVPPMGRPTFSPRPLRVRRGGALRERGRLSRPGAPRGLQIVFQPFILAAQPIALAFQLGALTFHACQFVTQARIVPARARQFVAQGVIDRRGTVRTIGHPPFMPVLRISYKYGILDRSATRR